MPWSQRIIQLEGRPAQVLIDDRFSSLAPVAELPRLARFGVFCRRDSGGGFWDPVETSSLDALEEDLIRLCGQFGRGCAAYVMRIDTRGLREYFVYSGGAAALAEVRSVLRGAHPDYRIDYEETTDADWDRYTTFLPDYRPLV